MRVKSLISVVICIAYIVISAGFVLTGGGVSANEFLGRIFCDVDFEKPHSLEFVPKTNSITEEYDEDIETHYVKLSKSTNDDAYVQNRISQANHVVFEADIMVEKAAVSIYPFYFRTNASANYTAANISITPSLEVITHDNVHITNISAGDWHNFALAADFSEMEFDFYVDGIKVLYEHPMKSVTLGSTLTCRMRLPTGEGETVWGFDNFMIYEAYRKLSREEFDELATSIDRPSAYPSDDDVKEALSGRVALDLQSRLIFRSGEKVEPDVPALVKKGTTYVPVRVVSEGFDMEVSWDVITQQIKLGDDITLWVGRSAAKVGDEMVSLPAAPEIRRGRVLVPLRALSELILGKEVFWDGTSLIVIGDGEYEGSSDEDLLTRTREFMKYVRPDRTKIRNDFINAGSVGVHPRLMIKPEDVQRMKDLIDSKDPFMTEALNRLKNVCAGYLYAAPVEYQMSSSKLLGQSRLLLARAHALGLYYLLTGYEEYAEALYRNLESVANFPDWNHHTHFLDVGEMAAGFAIGYDSIYNYLTPERRDILSDALKRHCIIPAREAHYNSGLKYYNNWNSVVNGGVAMAALMLADEPGYEEIAFDTVAKSIRALEYMMPEFAPDGAWEESPGYRNLAVAYCMRMFSSLESACGTNYGLTRATGFSGTGEFAAYVHGPTGLYNYHDASYSKPDIIELFWLAKTLKRPDYAALRLYHLETFGLYKTPYDMMFYDPSYETAEGEILPLDGYFRNTE
ncbi:MAG TPA: hypothetical protein GX706_05085, partial [Candidatus Moranbacteria bacterium]|nr:hypothetical protein [Candidatus Moranbacteria bacterium]